ncbi:MULTISPECIES: hypothetical protein [unclassified Inquilinus]
MDDGGGEMDRGGESLIGLVAAHGDAFEFFEGLSRRGLANGRRAA